MRVRSLLYHDVVDGDRDSSGFPGPTSASYKLERHEFAKHLKVLSESGRKKPSSVLDVLNRGADSSPFLLTFDDGGVSAHTQTASMLENLGWRGHFLITTNYLGLPGFVNKEQVRSLHERGHVVGTHSCSHPKRMSYCSWSELIKEWGESVKVLSDILGEPVLVASIPGGYYSRRVAEAAASVGIKALFTSEPRMRCQNVDGCLVLGRYSILTGMPPDAAAALASGRPSACSRQWVMWNAKKVAKVAGGRQYLKLRKLILSKTS